MASYEMHSNYESECRNACLFCLASVVASLLSTAALFLDGDEYDEYKKYSIFGLLYFFGTNILEDSVLMLPSISFIALLRCLHSRFVRLNSFLRFQFTRSISNIIALQSFISISSQEVLFK